MPSPPPATRLWPLPLLAGLLPAAAALIALLLYAQQQGAFCNAFVDDCVSISRMAKHGLANHLFRVLVLPGAVLQCLTWLVAAERFAAAGRGRVAVALMLAFGLVSAATLVVYGSFLGSDGEIYRWLRRRGPLLYFGGTFVAMLAYLRCASRRPAAHAMSLTLAQQRAMRGLMAFVAAVALCHALASAGPFARLEDRIENLSEWWGALALTLAFFVIARAWQTGGLVVSIDQTSCSRPRTTRWPA